MSETVTYHACQHYWAEIDEPEEGCSIGRREFPLQCNAESCPRYVSRFARREDRDTVASLADRARRT